MKIAIIADSHDNIPNIEKFLNWVKKNNIEMIIHCGDICAPPIITKILAVQFPKPIHLIFGNIADRERLEKACDDLDQVTLHGEQGEIKIDNKKIGLVHYPWEAEELAQNDKYDLIFYGHDHKPWEKQVGRTKLLNPGTLAGMFTKATFAVYDTATDKARLIVLEQI